MKDDLKSNALFRIMFQSTTEPILVTRSNGSIIMANSACEHLFGYNAETLISENIDILISQKYRAEIKEYLKNSENITVVKADDLFGIKKNGVQFGLALRLNAAVLDGKNTTVIFFTDKTNLKKDLQKNKSKNNALLESNRRYDILLNNLQGIVYRCKNNRDWTMDYISEGCKKITGYSPKEFLNGTVQFSDIVLKEDQEQIWNQTQKGIDAKTSFQLNFRIKDKKGNIKHMFEKGQGIFDENGNLEALEGFITDVTILKETETELMDSEDQTKALLEANPDMMFIQNRKGEYLEFYGNSAEKFFIPPKKFIGLNMKKVLPSDVYKIIKASHDTVKASKKMQVAEYSVDGKKGTDHYEARVVLLNDHKLLTIVRDVTEGKAKDALIKIRNNALASASNSIIIADAQQPDTPIIYCNEAFEKNTGYTKEETYGRNCNFLQNNDRDQKEIEIMKYAITNGEACNVILRNYKKDGTLFWNNIMITPIHDDEQKLTHFIGVQNDVTTLVKEQELKEKTQSILELIAKDKPIKVIAEKITQTIEANLKAVIATILLFDKSTRTLHKLVAPNLPKAFAHSIEGTAIGPKVGSNGTAVFLKKEVIVSHIETNVLWNDDKEMALKNGLKACWAFPIMSSTNLVLGVVSIYSKLPRNPFPVEKELLLDMTYLASVAIEKHQKIAGLKESKKELVVYAQELEEKVDERTKEVMETVKKLVETNLNLEDQIISTKQAENDAIASKSIASEIAKNFPNGLVAVVDNDLKIVFAEGEALAQLGLKQFSKEGMALDDVSTFAEERKAKIKDYVIKTLSGKNLSFEINYKNRYFSVNTAPLFDKNGIVKNALLVYTNISEQKEIEFKIQKSLIKEKELNELKSRFVSMASHEFRTPLSAILTSAILIGKQNEFGKEAKREKYVAQIEKNVNNLVVILNDFLSLSKLEEGKEMATPERFDVISFSKEIVNQSKVGLKKGQTLGVKTTIETVFVHLDAKLLHHILSNLISNASKYSSEGANISFKIAQNQHNVLLQITDQGIGIPEEEQTHLFQRFFRAKNVTNIEGTGLGLNIVKNYTELMGGTIGFKSELNKGSTFWVEFPLND